jgi:hypothetical protein
MYRNGSLPQVLLENHKCETCLDLLTIFKLYTVPSNTEGQKTWYQRKNTKKWALYIKHHYPTSEYQELKKNYHKNTISPKKL